jgi:RimJ/RimL family protein N-acetyltransferase
MRDAFHAFARGEVRQEFLTPSVAADLNDFGRLIYISRHDRQTPRRMTTLTTARLRLVPMADAHLDGLNALNADPQVMRYISGKPETRAETQTMIERVKSRWAAMGYSWWTFIEIDTGEIVGAGCLQNLRREEAPQPDPACPLELGWRLRRDRWGRGYASEAAFAMGDWAFDTFQPDELLAVCEPANTASSGVMKRIGMRDLGLQRWYGKDMATFGISADAWRASAATRKA